MPAARAWAGVALTVVEGRLLFKCLLPVRPPRRHLLPQKRPRWRRLGSRLSADYHHADGSPYASGTEYEFEAALESRKLRGTPEIYVYRNCQQPLIPIEPKTEREEKIRQHDALQSFLQRWFLNPDGTFRIASNNYQNLAEFEDKLESHMRKVIEAQAPASAVAPSALVRFGTYSKGSPFRRLRALPAISRPRMAISLL